MAEHQWMHSARRIVEERRAYYVHPYTGAILDVDDYDDLPEFEDADGERFPAVLFDLTTAAMLDRVWRNLSPKNQAEFATYGLAGAVEIGWKLVAKAR